MKVFITQYALTQGIIEKDAVIHDGSSTGLIEVRSSGFTAYYHREGVNWCRTLDEAKISAEKKRLKKIESIKKQLSKLEALKF